jgi:cytochrome P450
VDLEEEFRLLTLQIIGEAILSLPPEECDRVFPQLYLPVMEESNRRVLAPWRQLYPLTAHRYNSRVKKVRGGVVAAAATQGCCGVRAVRGRLGPTGWASPACSRAPPPSPWQLNDYIVGIIRQRRAARAANGGKPPAKPDILDRVLAAAEVGGCGGQGRGRVEQRQRPVAP